MINRLLAIITCLLFFVCTNAQVEILEINNSTEATAVPMLKLNSGTGGVSGSGGAIEFTKNSWNPMGRIYTSNIYSNGIGNSRGKLILSSYYNTFKDELTLWNGMVGIGITTPSALLHVNGNAIIGSGENGTGSNAALTIKGPNSPTDIRSFQDISYQFTAAGSARIRAYRGGSWGTYLQFLTNDEYAGGDNPVVAMHISANGNVGIGTTDPQEYKLAVNGPAIFTKVQVKAATSGVSWPDYVFHPTYQLRSLSSLAEYINQHKHLPDVPSADDVEKKGLDLGAIQAALLKKIEELTLYVIEQNRQLKVLNKKIVQLEKSALLH